MGYVFIKIVFKYCNSSLVKIVGTMWTLTILRKKGKTDFTLLKRATKNVKYEKVVKTLSMALN